MVPLQVPSHVHHQIGVYRMDEVRVQSDLGAGLKKVVLSRGVKVGASRLPETNTEASRSQVFDERGGRGDAKSGQATNKAAPAHHQEVGAGDRRVVKVGATAGVAQPPEDRARSVISRSRPEEWHVHGRPLVL